MNDQWIVWAIIPGQGKRYIEICDDEESASRYMRAYNQANDHIKQTGCTRISSLNR